MFLTRGFIFRQTAVATNRYVYLYATVQYMSTCTVLYNICLPVQYCTIYVYLYGTVQYMSTYTVLYNICLPVRYCTIYVYLYGTPWFIRVWFCDGRSSPVGGMACSVPTYIVQYLYWLQLTDCR
jgi:hypothetical protein